MTEPHRCCLRLTNDYAFRTAFDRAANLLMASGPVPKLWNLTTGRLLWALPITGFADYYADWDIALTPDGGRAVASFSSNQNVLVWNTASGGELLRWNAKCVATGMALTGDRALIGARISTLFFVRGTAAALDFWSFVQFCRSSATDHGRAHSGWYDLVAGPVMGSLRKQTVKPDGDQISFHTSNATAILDGSHKVQML